MMMIKSLALGLGIFLVGTVVYLILMLLPHSAPNQATGISVLEVFTIYNIWW